MNAFPYQEKAATRASSSNAPGMLLWHSAGSGKTHTSLKIIKKLREKLTTKKVLVIVPQSQTQKDFEDTNAASYQLDSVEYLQVSQFHATLASGGGQVLMEQYTIVAIDEAHKVVKSDQYDAMKTALTGVGFVLFITATPIQDDISDLSLYANCILKPGALALPDDRDSFRLKYAQTDSWKIALTFVFNIIVTIAILWLFAFIYFSQYSIGNVQQTFINGVLQASDPKLASWVNDLVVSAITAPTKYMAPFLDILKLNIGSLSTADNVVFAKEQYGYSQLVTMQQVSIWSSLYTPIACLCTMVFGLMTSTKIYQHAKVDMKQVMKDFYPYIDFYKLNDEADATACKYPYVKEPVTVELIPLTLTQLCENLQVSKNGTSQETKAILGVSGNGLATDQNKEYHGRRLGNIPAFDKPNIDMIDVACVKFDRVFRHFERSPAQARIVVYSNFRKDLDRFQRYLREKKGFSDFLVLEPATNGTVYPQFNRQCAECKKYNLTYSADLDQCSFCSKPLPTTHKAWVKVLLLDPVYIEGINLWGIYKFIVMEPIIGVDKQIQLYARVKRLTDPNKVVLREQKALEPVGTGEQECAAVTRKQAKFNCCRFNTTIVQMVATANPRNFSSECRTALDLFRNKIIARFQRKRQVFKTSGYFTDKKNGDYENDGFFFYVASTFDELIFRTNTQNDMYYKVFEEEYNGFVDNPLEIDTEADSARAIFRKAYLTLLARDTGFGRRIRSMRSAARFTGTLLYQQNVADAADYYKGIEEEQMVTMEDIVQGVVDDDDATKDDTRDYLSPDEPILTPNDMSIREKNMADFEAKIDQIISPPVGERVVRPMSQFLSTFVSTMEALKSIATDSKVPGAGGQRRRKSATVRRVKAKKVTKKRARKGVSNRLVKK